MQAIFRKLFLWLMTGMIVFVVRNGSAAQDAPSASESETVRQLEVPVLRDRVMDLAGILKDSEVQISKKN